MTDKRKPESPQRRRKRATAASRTTIPGAEQAVPGSGLQQQAPRALHSATIAVRWRDLDAFNHVNNSSFLTYLEEARLQWLKTVPGPWFDAHAMPVMAAVEANYRAPIEWPATIVVKLSCERLGNSSLTLAHRIVDAGDPRRLHCDGRVVMVWIDPSTGKPVALPAALRDACLAA